SGAGGLPGAVGGGHARLGGKGIEHLAHADDDLCEVCLAGAPLGAALAEAPPEMAGSAVAPLHRADALTRPALPVPFNPHLPRAPPAADAT
uniref:hypothetical protein n=1 Tax=Thiohalocapsa sp. TaxID=2497641 RepID=UPI0025CCBEDA